MQVTEGLIPGHGSGPSTSAVPTEAQGANRAFVFLGQRQSRGLTPGPLGAELPGPGSKASAARSLSLPARCEDSESEPEPLCRAQTRERKVCQGDSWQNKRALIGSGFSGATNSRPAGHMEARCIIFLEKAANLAGAAWALEVRQALLF